jgi:hypothetical protein
MTDLTGLLVETQYEITNEIAMYEHMLKTSRGYYILLSFLHMYPLLRGYYHTGRDSNVASPSAA